MSQGTNLPVAIIGGGFAGLSAGYELSLRGIPCTVYEREDTLGGLAGSFDVQGSALERFYHHWFTSDHHVTALASELGLRDQLVRHASRTGVYYANRHYRLSTPIDLLRFHPLPWSARLRLGLMTLKVRRLDDWRPLENETAAEWARKMGGAKAYEVVWEPLLRGKFGDVADRVSAVWLWNKLKLRGGSRSTAGSEKLIYLRGGFDSLTRRMAEEIDARGGRVVAGSEVTGIVAKDGTVDAVVVNGEEHPVSHVLATTALPEIADVVRGSVDEDTISGLERIEYLGNVCIVLELDRSLSETYWLNVNDLSFPFVGVIEHTNIEPIETYGGRHIVYLSRYLPPSDPLTQMSDDEVVAFSVQHLRRMFPQFEEAWVRKGHVWRARYAQPVVELNYSHLLDEVRMPFENFDIASMAQIYPEDRGTNYAVREGRAAARRIAAHIGSKSA